MPNPNTADFSFVQSKTQTPIANAPSAQQSSGGAGGGTEVPYFGDFRVGKIVRLPFPTANSGSPASLIQSPAAAVLKDTGTTLITAGVTLLTDVGGRTGNNVVTIDTSADATAYSAGSMYYVILTAGKVGNLQMVNVQVGSFSLEARSDLMATVVDRKLDVNANGEAGIDWANVGNPTTALALTQTTLAKVTPVDVDGLTFDDLTKALMAVLFGKVVALGGNAFAYKLRDGTTTKVTVTVGTTPGERTGSTVS